VQLVRRVESFNDLLDDLNISLGDLQENLTPGRAFLKTTAVLGMMAVWLLVAAPGALIFLVTGFMSGFAARQMTPRPDVMGTTKFLAGLCSTLALGTLLVIGFGFRFGCFAAVAAAIYFPVSGYATLQMLEYGMTARRLRRIFTNSIFLRKQMKILRQERDRLGTEIRKFVDRYES